MSSPWISRPVFLSSTFRDMHAERDHLRAEVFPQLEEQLSERRHHLEPIDLRWGVETVSVDDEHDKELLVLKVCLSEIERSRPFLIVLVGERYGWIPPEERMQVAADEAGFTGELTGKSVTALEIEFGALSNSDQLSRTWFYFRDPLPYDQMPEKIAADYQETNPEAVKRLDTLKQDITDAHPDRIRKYTLEWDKEENDFKKQGKHSLESFGQLVLTDLWSDLDEETKSDVHQPDPTWQDEERWELETFVEDRGRGFLGREETVRKLCALALSPVSENGYIGASVTGQAGSGKSSLFAHLCRQLENEDVLLLSQAAGISLRSQQVDSLLRRWIGELATFLKEADPSAEITDIEELETTFASLLGRASLEKRVVVLLDALNQFEPTVRAQHLTWWPKLWPKNARVIATAIPGTASAALEQRPGIDDIALPLLTQIEAGQIVHAVCQRYHRKINTDVVQELLYKKTNDNLAAGIPLWLELAVEELNLLDADDFQRADTDYEGKPEQRLHQLLLDTAMNLPSTVAEIYSAMLERTEKIVGKPLARGFANLIAISRTGWRERDLEDLLPRITGEEWNGLQFAILRRTFRAHLVRRGTGGQYDFFHQQMRQAVRKRNLQDDSLVVELHTHIADYLETLSSEEPLRQTELMFHLIGTDNQLRAACYYGGDLNDQELTGASSTLADHIIDRVRVEREDKLEWVLSLPDLEGISADQQSQLCNRFLNNLTDVLENETVLATRLQFFEQAHTTLSRLTSQEPTNTDWQFDLSVCHKRIGDVLLGQGDAVGAMTAYRETQAILERLASQDPTNTAWQVDLSICHERVGDVLLAQGDAVGAMTAFRECHAIAVHLAAQDPTNAGCQRDLSVSHTKIGDVLLAQGDAVGAMAAYRESLAIAEHLMASEPSNFKWQRILAVSHQRIGDVLIAQGDVVGSMTAYRESQAILGRLVSRDPTNASWQQNLSVSQNRVGNILLAQGDVVGAMSAYREQQAIAEHLASQDPTNAAWQRDLAVSHERVGDVFLAQGDAVGAMTAFRECQAILERLASQDPTNAGWQRDLAISSQRIWIATFSHSFYALIYTITALSVSWGAIMLGRWSGWWWIISGPVTAIMLLFTLLIILLQVKRVVNRRRYTQLTTN